MFGSEDECFMNGGPEMIRWVSRVDMFSIHLFSSSYNGNQLRSILDYIHVKDLRRGLCDVNVSYGTYVYPS